MDDSPAVAISTPAIAQGGPVEGTAVPAGG
jgi:hypothetical protein